MSISDDSVSQWITGLKSGDEAAAAKLWQRYFRSLMTLARKKLGASPRRACDEEDVALSAFHTFCQGAKDDRFPDLRDRDDLWHLVVCITERKAHMQSRQQGRQKRGAGLVQGESGFWDPRSPNRGTGINAVTTSEPTPEFATEMIETVERLFDQLDDDELRQIALCKLEGYSNEEIAKKIGRAERTVERRLKVIRTIWRPETGHD